MNHIMKLADTEKKYYNPMSLTAADKIVPQIHLAQLVKSLSPESGAPQRIIVMAPDYMKSLKTILSETPTKILHIHLLWKQIQAFGSFIEADAVHPLKQLSNELQGKVKLPTRFREDLHC